MWKGAKVAAACFVLAACAESKKEQLRQAQIEADAQAAAIAQVDDARCQSYAKPGSDAYVQCRASIKNHRAEMNAHIRGPEAPNAKGE